MSAGLLVSVTRSHDRTTVHLTGELDLATADQLRAALRTVHGPVQFDLEQLSFIDAAGLRVFVETASANGRMTIHHPTSFARRVLRLCEMDPWLADDATSRIPEDRSSRHHAPTAPTPGAR
jgi:anti-anti-sigma factor